LKKAEWSLEAGTRLGPYRIKALLGAGGMGEVYRAEDSRLGREVAVKVIRHAETADGRLVERFEREAKVLAALSHPHLLAVYDYGRQDGMTYIVTELLQGQTLAEKLKEGPLDLPSALRIACETAEGLAAAHGRGIIHRDLKPGNVFLSAEGHAKILDFGLARLAAAGRQDERPSEADTAERPTRPGTILGTAGYMAPEQAQGAPADARADVFTLGILIYEMVSGRRPFQGHTDPDLLAAVLRDQPAPLDRLDGRVPKDLARIVERCLEKEPSRRYPSAREAALALNALRSAGSVRLGGVPLLRFWLLAASALGLAAALFLAWALWSWIATRNYSLPPFEPRQITSRPEPEVEPAISPDGSAVAYQVVEGDASGLWVSDVRGGAPLRLATGKSFNGSPSWFPDGGSLAFVSEREGKLSIWKVERFGGPATLLLDNGSEPAVSPDGTRIAFSRLVREGAARIAVASLGDPRRALILTDEASGTWDHEYPCWSPDGGRICYQDQNDLWIVPAGGGKARHLTADDAMDRHPVWSPSGRYIYFDSFRDGTWALWRIFASGGAPERVTMGTGAEQHPSLSRDGLILAYGTRTMNEAIFMVDRSSGQRVQLVYGRMNSFPAFAPDGSAMVFSSNREGTFDLWKLPLREGKPGGELQRLTENEGSCSNPAWSPDGRWIAFHTTREGQRDVWVVAESGGAAVNFTEDPSLDALPQFSPDGKNISFLSQRDGSCQVWEAPFAGGRRNGPAVPLTHAQGEIVYHRWCPDGRAIAYNLAGSDLWLQPLSGGSPRRLTEGAKVLDFCVDPASGDFFCLGNWAGRFGAYRVPAGVGAPTPLAYTDPSPPSATLLTLSCSPDGKYLAISQQEQGGSVWLLQAKRGSF
jgi:Tol biopolymer transport system component/tRNA A-37 threonylcarbamoyl transferase component Bud32